MAFKYRDSMYIKNLEYESTNLRVKYKFKSKAVSDSLKHMEQMALGEVTIQNQLIVNKQQKRLSLLLGIILLGSILFGFLFYKRNKQNLLQKQTIQKQAETLSKQTQTLSKQTQQLQEVSNYRSNLFTNINHEMRTPLTLISLSIKDLGKHLPFLSSTINLLNSQTNKMIYLVNQILDISKVQNTKNILTIQHIDILQKITDIYKPFKTIALKKDIDYSLEVNESKINGWINVEYLEKILSNLIFNAFKFTEESGAIHVSVRTQNKGHRFLEITIADNGQGIKKELLPKVFELFYHTNTGSQTSSGIGLSMVKNQIDHHKGKIEVESTEEHGSRFIISLPIEKQYYEANNIAHEIKKDAETEEEDYQGQILSLLEEAEVKNEQSLLDIDKKTLLFVEDQDDLRNYGIKMFGQKYNVLTAKDGQEGIEVAITETPDIIISDVMMPNVSGYELIKKLKNDIRTSHIPIILLTAKTDAASQLKGIQLEADDYITKPFSKEHLLAKIENLFVIRNKLKQKYQAASYLKSPIVNEGSIDKQFINHLNKIIDQNIDNTKLGGDEIANQMNMSKSNLYRKLNAVVGLGLNNYIKNIRLRYAYELLQLQAGSISEIAYKSGFSSPNYFGKSFKKQYGFSPKELRNPNLVVEEMG